MGGDGAARAHQKGARVGEARGGLPERGGDDVVGRGERAGEEHRRPVGGMHKGGGLFRGAGVEEGVDAGGRGRKAAEEALALAVPDDGERDVGAEETLQLRVLRVDVGLGVEACAAGDDASARVERGGVDAGDDGEDILPRADEGAERRRAVEDVALADEPLDG